jgi:hypothetical protein
MKVVISSFHELRDALEQADFNTYPTVNRGLACGSQDALSQEQDLVHHDAFAGGSDFIESRPCYLLSDPESLLIDAGY